MKGWAGDFFCCILEVAHIMTLLGSTICGSENGKVLIIHATFSRDSSKGSHKKGMLITSWEVSE